MIKRIFLLMVLCTCALTSMAQGNVKGKVLDKATDEPMPFVNIVITKRNDDKMIKGAITDENGGFSITGIADGDYTLTVSYVGYKEVKRNGTKTDSQFRSDRLLCNGRAARIFGGKAKAGTVPHPLSGNGRGRAAPFGAFHRPVHLYLARADADFVAVLSRHCR